jgi:surfeit locus 1 family protein
MARPGHSAAPSARAQQPQPGPDGNATGPGPDSSLRAPPSLFRRAAFNLIALLVFAGFLALAWWQLERRAWKLDLIDRVEQRVHAAPVPIPVPGPQGWPAVTAASDEYRRVEVRGSFLYDRQTLVQAATALGSGFWVMTPLRMADGGIVLINRGFIAPPAVDAIRAAAHDASLSPPADAVNVTGLLRLTQPGGGFLRHNDAAADRWFSRDVQAIAAARGLPDVAPYFVDADAGAAAGAPNASDATRAPVGGLTVIAFPNNHLVYAITWLVLALMTAGATWRTWRSWHPRREPPILREKQKRGERENANNRNDGDPGNVH